MDPLPFTVQERDLDLLLLEQAHVSEAFLARLAAHAGLPGARLLGARHSVSTAQGETDVLLILEHRGARVALMIEDKTGATFQPGQAERYHERGRDLCAAGEADRYLTLLCAPAPTSRGWRPMRPGTCA